jgi:hypothetical protein
MNSILHECIELYFLDCGPPPVSSNAHVNIYTGSTIGKNVDYKCDPGYQKVGPLGSTCKSDITWTILSNECLPRKYNLFFSRESRIA